MGHVSLIFWPFTFLGNESPGRILATIQVRYGIWPFITARISKRALHQGKIQKAYLVLGLTAIPVAALLLYFVMAVVLESMVMLLCLGLAFACVVLLRRLIGLWKLSA